MWRPRRHRPECGRWLCGIALVCRPCQNSIHVIGVRENRSDPISPRYMPTLCSYCLPFCRTLNTATVLISAEGAGKSIIFQHFLANILGPQCFLSESRADALFGTYNGCLSGKVCVVAEELPWAGSHRDAGILKDMLTSDTLSLKRQVPEALDRAEFRQRVRFDQ